MSGHQFLHWLQYYTQLQGVQRQVFQSLLDNICNKWYLQSESISKLKDTFLPSCPSNTILNFFLYKCVEEKKYYQHLIMLTLFTIIYNIIIQLSVIYTHTHTHISPHIFYTDGYGYTLYYSEMTWFSLVKEKLFHISTACSDFYSSFCCFFRLHNHTLWVTMAVYVDFVAVKASFKHLRTKWYLQVRFLILIFIKNCMNMTSFLSMDSFAFYTRCENW